MIVYVNGDSYSSVSNGRRYSEFLGEYFSCDSINAAISGSSNRRIFRTSLRDLMSLNQTHNNILAVISLTFPLRTEVWDPDVVGNNKFINDGEFVSVQTTTSKRWFKDGIIISEESKYKGYINEWLRWYNIEAEIVELFREILLLTSWCKQHNIKYVIFTGALQEPVDLESSFINSFYKEVSKDPNIIDIFRNSFTEWCIGKGYQPIDDYTQEIHGTTYIIGHHGEDAHRDFAHFLIDNYLGNK